MRGPPYKQVAMAILRVEGMSLAETDAVSIASGYSLRCLRV
jgi:hypothetical protein